MRHIHLLPAYLLVTQASAQQTSDLLSILASEAYSIFTSVTSAIGATTTSASSTTSNQATGTSTSSISVSSPSTNLLPSITLSSAFSTRTSSSQSSSSPTTTTSSSSASSSPLNTSSANPSSATSQSGTANAASATSATASVGNSSHDRNLAIILGTVLGALALGLLILLILILCKRRRRRRDTARHGSLSSNSDEALTARQRDSSRKGPVAGALLPRRSTSLGRTSNVDAPSMTERSNYDVPSAYNFQNSNSAPFVPGAKGLTGSPGVVSTGDAHVPDETGHFREGTGLNNHPYRDNHHVGSALAAGAGGAAIGAAAARRHSRSSERNHRPRLSGDSDVHPAYWEGPPPRSPHRKSIESAKRRSGGTPRDSLHMMEDHNNDSPRNSVPTAALSGTAAAGAVSGVTANRAGRRSHERGRSLPLDPPLYNGYADRPVSNSPRSRLARQSIQGPDNAHNVPVTPLPSGRRGDSSSSGRDVVRPVTAGAVGAGLANESRSRSHSGPHPPLPPSLVIPNGNNRRSLPSRSPKRTRFADNEDHREPMPYDDRRFSNPGGSLADTAASNQRTSFVSPLSMNNRAEDELVSPISPEDMYRRPSRDLPISSGKANLVRPSRSRSVSPMPSAPDNTRMPLLDSQQPPTASSYEQPRPAPPQKQHSGLLSAVQDHFSPTSTAPRSSTYDYVPYSPASNGMLPRASTFPDPNSYDSRQQINRKPVPMSTYNSHDVRPPMSSTADSRRDRWFRGQEDSAWEQSYRDSDDSRTGIGQARYKSPISDSSTSLSSM